ncbi:hypothetical protein SAMCCGM7_Ch3420 [Sinorhizobium americanum CCGM7]|uniref:hypothetical protein n=1 Tax=Sinorhizobium americanum TaxID=194963 RepID=UPI0004D55FB7|nr:hypothetical protein [Sinorhizobium americanum]APG86136.1 hypothetical protein SAMCCGM7_Ch3420 [Sinorhizobium americanum CCGM7]
MNFDIIDVRRFFRNRFEYYMDNKDSHSAGVNDGAPVTLRNLCRTLADDQEPFPRRYDPDMKKLCGHEYLTWLREERSYGDVARLIGRLLAAEDGQMPQVGVRWVHAALKRSAAD